MANSTMRIELNNGSGWQLLTGLIDGVTNFSVTLRNMAEDGTLAKSFSSELTFYEDGYKILKTALIDDPFGFSKSVQIRIFDDCCREAVFEGVIKGDAIDWCEPKCYISANIIEDEAKINCIKSTLIWDNHNGFLNRQQPIIRYCIETRPEFLQYLLINLGGSFILIFQFIFFVLVPVIFVIFGLIYFVCQLINNIPGVDADCNGGITNPFTLINNISELISDLKQRIAPCGNFHPSPYVRDYITNACQKCGIQFQSSILNNPASPYYNTVLFAAQVRKGRIYDSTDYSIISENRPIETIETLMNQYLKVMFNAEFQIVNNVLVFERKDYFLSTSSWIDTEQLLNQRKIENNEICFSWIDKERWAFGNFQYSSDFIDYIGNEAIPRFNDIVEWNSPYNPAQKGSREVLLQVGASRHRKDGGGFTVYDFYQTNYGAIVNFIFNNIFSDYDQTLLINQQVVGLYKFMIYDTSSGTAGLVKHDYSDSFCGGDPGPNSNERFNYPFWFNANYSNNLYSLFHYIDDPRLPGTTQFEFNFQFQFDCQTYKDFNFSKTIRLVKNGQIVNGIVKELNIDFTKRIIQVSGIV